MNLQKIKEIAKARKISLVKLAKEAGVTEQGLHTMIRNNTCRLEALESIANTLGVPVGIFFNDDAQTFNNIIGNDGSVIQTGSGVLTIHQAEQTAVIKNLQKELEEAKIKIIKLQAQVDAYKELLKKD